MSANCGTSSCNIFQLSDYIFHNALKVEINTNATKTNIFLGSSEFRYFGSCNND